MFRGIREREFRKDNQSNGAHFWQSVAVAEASSARLPSGSLEEDAEALAPAVRSPGLLQYVLEVKVLNVDRVEGLDRMHETVCELFVSLLRLERAEHAVPDDEHAGVVLVNAVRIAAVVNAMVARRVEHVLKRADSVDRLFKSSDEMRSFLDVVVGVLGSLTFV